MTEKNVLIPEDAQSHADSAEVTNQTPLSAPKEQRKTRREVLAGGLAALVFGKNVYGDPGTNSAKKPTSLGGASSGHSGTAARPGIQPGPAACIVQVGSKSAIHRLIDKATFGWTSATETDVTTMGYNAWLNQQLDPYSWASYLNFESNLATQTDPTHGYGPYPTLAESAGGLNLCAGNDAAAMFAVRYELVRARVIRAIYSPAQLLERMVEFWTDHFNVYHQMPNANNRYKTLEDTHHIRPNALGKFSNLLKASALSPAMLLYLNGVENTAGSPNENHAREIMELHTLGVDNGYDQGTIVELAKMMTGWEVVVPNSFHGGGANCGAIPPFNNSRHDDNAKTLVFPANGNPQTYNIPAGLGMTEIDVVVDILTDPGKMGLFTAGFIADKMCRWLSSYSPPQALKTAVVDAYVANWADPNANEIAEMVKVILSQTWINCAKDKIKRPLHLLASTARACGATISDPGTELQSSRLVGGYLSVADHIPYNKQSPDGYPDGKEEWADLRTRWEAGARWSFNTFSNASISTFVSSLPTASVAAALDALDNALFGGFMSQADRTTITNYFNGVTLPLSLTARREMTSLVLASPSFQCY
ncbi:MAG: DUF1800 domain-containing protein [Phycisphaerales bacterium]|nr:DUF1800 domain-containing protein [Phycisphaerales bacterium]MCB9854755.1 DUF1800 domain-containing protein [Phycisphaerales bacterium]MCB9863773.1 DUF1800 domain-containing protein [Phycisphaerales bacterium]